jgi:hypothetical protein
MIKKFDGEGGVVEVGGGRIRIDGQEIEITSLQSTPEQKYVGEWAPGKNHPHQVADEKGPYAGIVRYLPIPEDQIVR